MKTDYTANKVTVTGKVDPTEIKEKLEQKIKKKVELVSPQPKKDGGGDKKPAEKAEKKEEPKKEEPKKPIQVCTPWWGHTNLHQSNWRSQSVVYYWFIIIVCAVRYSPGNLLIQFDFDFL